MYTGEHEDNIIILSWIVGWTMYKYEISYEQIKWINLNIELEITIFEFWLLK